MNYILVFMGILIISILLVLYSSWKWKLIAIWNFNTLCGCKSNFMVCWMLSESKLCTYTAKFQTEPYYVNYLSIWWRIDHYLSIKKPCIFIVIREYFGTVTHAKQLFIKRILLRVLNKAFNSRVKFHIIVIFDFNFCSKSNMMLYVTLFKHARASHCYYSSLW